MIKFLDVGYLIDCGYKIRQKGLMPPVKYNTTQRPYAYPSLQT